MNEDNIPPGSLSIRFLSGPLAGQTFPIRKSPVTIGRASTNDIVVKDDLKVSRTHARLLWHNGSWSIEKLAPSQNTLTVNRQQVQQATITNNTTIHLGADTSFLFLIEPEKSAAPPPPTNAIAASAPLQYSAPPPYPAQPLPPSSGPIMQPGELPDTTQLSQNLPSLVVSSNIHGTRQSYPLTNDIINIGRDSSNDISIKDGRIVSTHHLQIIRQNGQFILIHPHPDQPRTLNGLLYQGRKIRGDEPFRKTLTNGDIFRIGDENGSFVTLTYHDGRKPPQ